MPRTAVSLVLLALVALTVSAAPADAADPQTSAVDAAGIARVRAFKRESRRAQRAAADEAGIDCLLEKVFRNDPARFRDSFDHAPQALAEVLGNSESVGMARIQAPGARRFARELGRLDVDDPIVETGIAAWQDVADWATRLAKRPYVSCVSLVRWIRSGYAKRLKPKTSPLGPDDFKVFRSVIEIQRAERRLLQLGASSAGARGFATIPIYGGNGILIVGANDG